MASKHAVLALLIERPDYGYGLHKRLDQRCSAWGWSRSAVYKALEELTDAKHVHPRCETEVASKKSRRSRIFYESTRGGVAFYQKWMFDEVEMETPRQELELKIVLARPHELPKLIEMTLSQEQACVDRVASMARQAKKVNANDPFSWPEVYEKLHIDTEIKRLRLRVECLQESRRTMQLFLERIAKSGPGG